MAVKFKNNKEIFEALVDKCTRLAKVEDFRVEKNLGSDFTKLGELGDKFKETMSLAQFTEDQYRSITAEIEFENKGKKITMSGLLSKMIEKADVIIEAKKEAAKKLLAL